jgi:hypothetical protein
MIGLVPVARAASDNEPAGGHRPGPPQAAIDACKDKGEGAAVEFTNRRGHTIKAVCKSVNGRLLAVPEGGFHHPHGVPPGGAADGERDQ